jgi:hypothetical protein
MFSRDGIPDLVSADNGSDTVSILLGNGDGTFIPSLSSPVGNFPYSVAIGDLNRDGILDLAVTNFVSDTVSILLGNGDGTFIPSLSSPVGYNPASVAIGDLNRDGIQDLVTADYGGYTVSILLGNGDGTFIPSLSPPVGLNPASVAIGDLNRDGILDLVSANVSSDTVSILLNTKTDEDNDGILYEVDTMPSVCSDLFSDQPLGGRTTGTIVDRGDQILTIADAPDPQGVVISTDIGGGGTPATITGCEGEAETVTFGAGAYGFFTCGNSFTMEVISGVFDLEFLIAGDTATVSLGAGNSLTCDPDTGTLTADPDNSSTIDVYVGGEIVSLAPGDVKVFSKIVNIDIKPGSDPNCFNSDGKGIIPVAILGSADFDAATVNPFTVSLDGAAVQVKGRSGNAGSLEDVNGDGIQDLVVQIIDEGGFTSGDSSATLTGETFDGTPIEGSDSICIVP